MTSLVSYSQSSAAATVDTSTLLAADQFIVGKKSDSKTYKTHYKMYKTSYLANFEWVYF